MREYPNLNHTYLSEPLKDKLSKISHYPITQIIAPSGYGKTTAIKCWDEYRRKSSPDSVLYRITAEDSSLPEFWEDLCHIVHKENPILAEKMMKTGFPENRRTMFLLMELWEETECEDQELYFVIDDAHNLPPHKIAPICFFFAEYLPPTAHLILLSRNPVVTYSQRMKLGHDVLSINREELQLDFTEIREYAKCCGLPLSEHDAEHLALFSGGWIALIYLTFCIFAKTGTWQFGTADIDRLIMEVMLNPLTDRERDFLTVCSAAPEFTLAQAAFLWNQSDADELIEKLSSENAFIAVSTNGTYRCHHLLRQNAMQQFMLLPDSKQHAILSRLGDWYKSQEEYFAAMTAYRRAENWENLLETIEFDQSSSLGGAHKEIIEEWCQSCPADLLRTHPKAILVFALQRFIGGDIPGMLRLNHMLLEIAAHDPKYSQEEQNNYRGESEILTGFLEFNNISAMSVHHREACRLMNRKSCFVTFKAPWTFGSPSVLMLYHRQSGALDQENQEMRDCMPYYYRLTQYHGYGAEYAAQAETELLRGRWQNTEICCYQASRAASQKNQYSILVAAEFTAGRLDMIQGNYRQAVARMDKLRQSISAYSSDPLDWKTTEGLEESAFTLLPTIDMCMAWFFSILGCPELIPEWIFEENAMQSAMNVGLPAFLTIQNVALLAKGEWARMAAREKEIKDLCADNHTVLCLIYAHIHLAAAFYQLGWKQRAEEELNDGLTLAKPDHILLPFAEFGVQLRPLLEGFLRQDVFCPEVQEILHLSDSIQTSIHNILQENFGKQADYGLSEREMEIVQLSIQRKTIKEISELLYLSENTVKWHLKNIYSKVGITGSKQNKRKVLEERFQ